MSDEPEQKGQFCGCCGFGPLTVLRGGLCANCHDDREQEQIALANSSQDREALLERCREALECESCESFTVDMDSDVCETCGKRQSKPPLNDPEDMG